MRQEKRRAKEARGGKTVFVIIDGLADSLKYGRTSLENADAKNLDWFASNGRTGMVYTVAKGIAPESDIAVLSVLGYNPFRLHTGRGPLEAFGVGMKLGRGIALRGNFATSRNGKIIDRRAGKSLTTREAKMLEREINAKVRIGKKFLFRATVGHRGVLVISGNFSPKVSNTDPEYLRMGLLGIVSRKESWREKRCVALEKTYKAKEAARAINEFVLRSRKVLEKSSVNAKRRQRGLAEANVILLRDAGTRLPMLKAIGINTGRKWCAVAGMPLERGIARASKMKERKFSYPEWKAEWKGGDYWNWARKRIRKCCQEGLKAIRFERECDAFYIHFKETDEAGHEGKQREKERLVAQIDREFFSKLRKMLDMKKDRLVVTADHATPPRLARHSSDPVPILVWGRGISAEGKGFSERQCMRGSIGTICGEKVILYTK